MDETKNASGSKQSWLPFWIALGAVLFLTLVVLFTLELIPPPSFLRGAFMALRQALVGFELGLISLFS